MTGARIARPDPEQSNPIGGIGNGRIKFKGAANIENVLNDLPQATGDTTSASNNPGGGGTVNLRHLGAQRTLATQDTDGNGYVTAITTGFKDPVTGVVSGLPNGGELVCANAVAGCVPANMFGLGTLDTGAANFLAVDAVNRAKYTSQAASAVLANSSIADLGAGGIGVAPGAEYRKEKGST